MNERNMPNPKNAEHGLDSPSSTAPSLEKNGSTENQIPRNQ